MRNKIYNWLMENRDPRQQHEIARVFALIVSSKAASPRWTLEDMLGLSYIEFVSLIMKYFPHTLTNHEGERCVKVDLHLAAKEAFTCHCCGQAVSAESGVKRIDIPLFKGYPPATNRQMEVDDLRALLLSHRSFNSEEEIWFANMIAVSSLGENHLWQDLGVSGRPDVSFILKTCFTGIFDKNIGDMKWKKFFYKQLCDLDDIKVCKAPSCSECCDYPDCFGSEC